MQYVEKMDRDGGRGGKGGRMNGGMGGRMNGNFNGMSAQPDMQADPRMPGSEGI